MVCGCDGEQLMGNNNNNQERLMNMAAIANSATYSSTSLMAAKAEQLKCPRCDSSNTKFCYYNNYSLSQPRHLCKACKRYWTRGGTLRDVPVGGGCRKNKRVKRRNASSSNASPCTGLPKMGPDPRRPASLANPNLPVNHYPDPLSSSSHDLNSLFFGITNNISPQLSALGFGGIPNFFLNASDTNYSGFNGSDDQLKGPQIGEYNQSLPPSHANLSADDNVIMGNPVDGSMDQWQANCPFEALNYNASSASLVNGASSDSISYIYWNNSTMGSPGWPDPSSNSSVAPLI